MFIPPLKLLEIPAPLLRCLRSATSLRVIAVSLAMGWILGGSAAGQVVLNEIHYHPVELAAFDADGHPVLDLSVDVHEFIELHNPGPDTVSLEGWKLENAVEYTFPSGSVLAPGGYCVVAADPARLVSLRDYALEPSMVFGPYSGRLGNGGGETVRLRTRDGVVSDAMNYGSSFPWPSAADALGASERWTKTVASQTQYRGRSLERVSPSEASSSIANWKASVFPGNPTPGRPNSTRAAELFPVVERHALAQSVDGSFPIRDKQNSRVDVLFSSALGLGKVRLEYFVDEINRTNETVFQIPMEGAAPAFSATLPPFASRSVVRYRVMAERQPRAGGAFEERVLPRLDDAFSWMGFFVVSNRPAATNDAYDLFLSTNSITQLTRNFSDNPINGYNPKPGTPVLGRFNDTEPAFLAYQGNVYDVQVRHSGSFYRRDVSRTSFKVEFPSYAPLQGHTTLLLLDKGSENILGHRLFAAMGFPTSRVRPVDVYFNNQSRLVRLEFEESDEDLMQRWADAQKAAHPDLPKPGTGHLYKSSGFLQQGPYGPGNGTLFGTNEGWPPIQRYEWVYSSKNKDWEGYWPFKDMMDAIWAARGPLPNTDVPKLKPYLEDNWDVDQTLFYMAIRSWMGVWDDSNHNYYVWKRSDGRWTMLPWDFDGELSDVARDIFSGENGNYFKDAFFKCFREEFKRRLWWLNNTAFHPDNLWFLGFNDTTLNNYATDRLNFVNGQTYGTFERPRRPIALSPSAGESASGVTRLVSSPYAHSRTPASGHTQSIWSIRSDVGTHVNPVYAVTSRTDLLSLEIPASALKAGRMYYWSVIHLDAEGHPSLPSKEEAFHFGGSYRRADLVSLGDSWRYLDSGTNLGRAWREFAFDDSKWSQGRGLLGVATNTPPVPVLTPVKLGTRTYYFRTHFNLPSAPGPRLLRLRHIVDDGAVFYINGQEIYRYNLSSFYSPGGVPATVKSAADIPSPGLEVAGSFVVTNLVAGDNLLAVEVHQFTDSSPDVLMGAALDTALEVSAGVMRLNEVLAINRAESGENGPVSGWVELYNPGEGTVDMGGISLTDDPSQPLLFSFPAGSYVGARGRVRILCDGATGAVGYHASITLKPEGGQLWLQAKDAQGNLLEMDHLSYGLQIPDFSIGRVPEGTGEWRLAEPSPLGENVAAELGTLGALRINEWMAAPQSGSDWFELFNPELLPVDISRCALTDDSGNPTNSIVPALSFLAPGSFRRLFADSKQSIGADHVDFKLSGTGEAIELRDASLRMIDSIRFGLQQEGISQGRFPDGSDRIVSLPKGGSPGTTNRGDAEGDGLPDDWELAHGLGMGTQDATGDLDGDGSNNLAEFLAGTDPRDPGSHLRLLITPLASSLRLSVNGIEGKVYDIQQREAVSQGPWLSVGRLGPGSVPQLLSLELPWQAGESRCFRLVLRRY